MNNKISKPWSLILKTSYPKKSKDAIVARHWSFLTRIFCRFSKSLRTSLINFSITSKRSSMNDLVASLCFFWQDSQTKNLRILAFSYHTLILLKCHVFYHPGWNGRGNYHIKISQNLINLNNQPTSR